MCWFEFGIEFVCRVPERLGLFSADGNKFHRRMEVREPGKQSSGDPRGPARMVLRRDGEARGAHLRLGEEVQRRRPREAPRDLRERQAQGLELKSGK